MLFNDTAIETAFYANGKLLLSGEYFVLDGALALALPTRLGQSLSIYDDPAALHGRRQGDGETGRGGDDPFSSAALHWTSYDEKDRIWYEGQFEMPTGKCLKGTNDSLNRQMEKIWQAIEKQRPGFLAGQKNKKITARLGFPLNWGLGSSSTLIANLAAWTKIDPFQLLADTFGGSGYDIACSRAPGPVLFQKIQGRPHFVHFPLRWPFLSNLYFVFLGKKQDSREGIARYRAENKKAGKLLERVSGLSAALAAARKLTEFRELIAKHEQIVSRFLELPRAKDLYFQDYWGEIKSLGAWGGDFVLATSERPLSKTKKYFNEKGYDVVLSYDKLILF